MLNHCFCWSRESRMSGIVAPCSLLSVPSFFFFAFVVLCVRNHIPVASPLSAIEVLWRACSLCCCRVLATRLANRYPP